ncbi:GAF domain-containing protein [Thiovibrio frasassiensis]|uniref:histidine kinase n=1 Tax=Thiovibrio frasassiensis TaxID=2984131 RepID=A0A9X4RLW4_9BACT|nr:GAF domain-containing protein [Thiovibrio frasassiensis]MDG4475775.1 GAF domain-containing protein [Thiovibrio frasassiensis]
MATLHTIITGFWPTKIRSQLILGVALVHLLLMSFFVFDLVARQRDFLSQQSLEQTKSLADTLAINSSSWVLANDVAGLQEIVLAVGQYPGLHFAMVITTDGKVLAHTEEARIGQKLSDEKSRALLSSEPTIQILYADRRILDIAAPILTNTGHLIGWARIAQGQEQIASNLVLISRNGLLYTLLAIVAGSLLAVLLGNRLTSSLNRLLGVCRQIKEGRRDLRMEISRHDEIGLLGEGLNTMLDAIIANENLILLNQQRLESLANIFQFQAANQQELLDYALEQALQLSDSRIGYIYYYDEETREFSLNSWSREVMQVCSIVEPKTRYHLDSCGLWGEAVRQRRPILVNNYHADSPFKKGCPQGHAALHNYLTIPVFHGEKIIAVLGVANRESDYQQGDVGQLTLLMDAVWKLVERKRAEEALRENRAMLQQILDTVPQSIFWKDKALAYLGCNRVFAQAAGLDEPGQITGKTDFDLPWPKEEGEAYRADDRKVIGGKQIKMHIVEPLQQADGKRIWIDTTKVPLRDGEGTVYGVLGVFEDITERMGVAQALEQSAREWSAAMDASDDIIYLLNLKREIVRANKAFYLATSTSPETAIGRHILEIIHPQGEPVPCPVCRAQEEKSDLQLIMEADNPDNPVARPLEITVKIVRDHDERPVSILMTLHDLSSARKEMEEKLTLEKQLRQAQKMEAIGTLAGGIAHDFNNILSIIFGYSELAMEATDPQSCRSHLEEVKKGAERATELVRQILTFSRKVDQQKLPLQVSLVVKEALKMLRASIPTTIALKQNIISDATVLADPTQIHQIMMNLCTNAYHAMRETGGTLFVSLNEVELDGEEFVDAELPPGKYLKLEVSDTGCGMAPKIKEKIFEPYFTTKKQGEGTGMGLAVVHGIVKSHHGHITVDSEEGKGTSIQVYLPLTAQSPDEIQTPVPPTQQSGKGEQILFVDDEEQIRGVTATILSKHGYQITTRTNGVEALAEFKKQPDRFQLLITDMTMPAMTGAELAREILALKPEMPIILCTGQSDLINREKALAMGITDYLNKPFTIQTILTAIKNALEQG